MKERFEQMMEQVIERMTNLMENQNIVNMEQQNNNNNNRHENSDGEVSDNKEEEEYYEETLFFDTDDGENEDAIIGDEPIFDEDDEKCNELLQSGDTRIALVERRSYLTPKVTNDKWLHNNILSNYQDTSSCENINFIEAF